MKNLNINKGITLVALVITVIVLLILATVGIGAIVGEDGLITKAQEAAELYEQASRNEANAINEIFNMVNGGSQGGSEEPTQPVIDATNTNVQFIYIPSTPTKGSVTVEITTTTGYMIQYRKGETGNYSRYTGAFTVEENTVIYAKLANSSGVTGGYATGNVANIDKVAPNAFTPTIGEITETSIEINASTTDTGSIGCAAVNTGIKEYKYYANGELKDRGLKENVTIGGLTAGTEYSIYVIAEDKAGNTTTSSVVPAETTTPKPITSTEIANNPEEYYGEYVDYTPQNGAEVGWRIFYADSENIYLIADDYVENKYAPNGKNKDGQYIIEPNKNGEWQIYFRDIVENDGYSKEDIANWIHANKWISKLNNFIDGNGNLDAIAYLLDTIAWSEFTDNKNEEESKVEYIIGGPTLEMFVASYNATRPNGERTLACEETTNYGYKIRWSDGSYQNSISSLKLDNFYSLYVKDTNINRAFSYWLASPSASYNSSIFNVYYNITSAHYYSNDSYNGFCPIICLKSETKLVEQEGKYVIQ